MQTEECIFFQLAKARQSGGRFLSNMVSTLKLTAAQATILNFLYDQDRITSKELAERALLDNATLSGILDRLEAAGLIKRQPHPKDRRALQICLTEDGSRMAGKTHEIMAYANTHFLSGLNEKEKTTLVRLLTKIRT